MKKMLFSAIAMVAFSVSGFANEDGKDVNEDDFGCVRCVFKTVTYDLDGNPVVEEQIIRVCNNTCEQADKKYKEHLQKKGLLKGDSIN